MAAPGLDSKCEAQVPIIYADLVNKGGGVRGGAGGRDLLLTI